MEVLGKVYWQNWGAKYYKGQGFFSQYYEKRGVNRKAGRH